ncbi:sister chromatid cohesion protein DCC1 [Aplysia californica]|uniref:Sister chromatid cohesion protein DCC1 n=1 Tax=Aplysia californica TaxID=6500 RepID=A0ABM0K2A4_APLCA|nr:sister chromatid cohesion protein DCC1 [Aplysia californica]
MKLTDNMDVSENPAVPNTAMEVTPDADDQSQETESEGRQRSLSDINSILEFAKLERSDFKPQVQCLYFSEHLENDSIKLLELDQPVLDSILSGKSVTIRGDKNDGAVLVTDDKTYDFKEAETSNSMLLLPQLSFSSDLPSEGDQEIVQKKVGSVIYNYYELRPIKPRLKKLRKLLEENPYRGKECEGDELDTGKKYTLPELQDRVQASNKEIVEGLRKLNACELSGYWRVLDFEFLSTVVYHVLQLCDENDWLTTGVDLAQCCDVLQELFPIELVQHVVRCFARDGDGEEKSTATAVPLCEDKVCKHFAELCLRNSGKFNLSDFSQAWQQSVPEGMTTSLSQIQGMALIDRSSQPEVIWYYCVDDLPDDVAERFEVLFEERKKWSLEEITPYVIDLTSEKTDVGALLTKFARASMLNGIKVFSSRKTL